MRYALRSSKRAGEGKDMQMIKIKNTRHINCLYNAVEFVYRATMKDEVQPYRRYIYKDNEFLVASDGHRLFMALLDNVVKEEREAWAIEEGAYEVVRINKKELTINKVENAPEFPANWSKYFRLKDYQCAETLAGGSHFGIDKAVCDTIRLCPGNKYFGVDCLKDVFKSAHTESWTVLMGGGLQSCLFKNKYKRAVVMPIKMKDEKEASFGTDK